ncbi:MAG: 2Fe-2S iron-sulfur cluster binding domain-containing protein, partial [Planctomycetes bacterium]|nr:2Fe-2S iron-sulfur cluster binding domain-containing protein [Planctomycetota bacterium]
MTVSVDFEPVGRRGDCPAGGTLLDCARRLGVELASLCGGAGTCGRCRVQVLAGSVSEPTAVERETLPAQELGAGYRLACQAYLLGDSRLHVPPESLTAPQRT